MSVSLRTPTRFLKCKKLELFLILIKQIYKQTDKLAFFEILAEESIYKGMYCGAWVSQKVWEPFEKANPL